MLSYNQTFNEINEIDIHCLTRQIVVIVIVSLKDDHNNTQNIIVDTFLCFF